MQNLSDEPTRELRGECAAGQIGGERFPVAVGAARHHRQPGIRDAAASEPVAPLGALFESAHASHAGKQSTRSRCQNDPEQRFAARDERDIDREFAVARDELARAVEWIDEPESLLDARHAARAGSILADDRHCRRDARELCLEQRPGAVVGVGDGRGVGLACDLELGGIDRHDQRTGGADDRDDPVEQFHFR